MKRGPLQAAAGLVIVLVLAGCAQRTSVSSALRPSIVIVSYFPVTIEGHRFRPGEKVILQAQPHQGGLKPAYLRLRAKSDGAFTVLLRGNGLDRCTGFTVWATGSAGSRATVRSSRYGCPPVPAPSAHAPSQP